MAHDPSRTEQATPKRRDKARKEGNVPKSQELPKPVTLLAGLLVLRLYLETIHAELERLMDTFLRVDLRFDPTPATVYTLFQDCLQSLTIMLLPLLLVISLAAFVTVRLQVGKLWAPKAATQPDKYFSVHLF